MRSVDLYILLCFLFSLIEGRLYKYLILENRSIFLVYEALLAIVIHFRFFRDTFYGNRIKITVLVGTTYICRIK
jgi:hypothetical protein